MTTKPCKRDPVEITRWSAANIAKYLIKEQIKSDADMPVLTKMAMTKACEDGGAVEEIAKILYGIGLKITINKSDPEHREWLDGKAVEIEG